MIVPYQSSGESDSPTLEAVLIHNVQRYDLLPASSTANPQPLVVGVSGGADSVGLLHALAGLTKSLNLCLHVAHVDHGLRPQASADAAFVRTLSRELGLPFHLRTLETGSLLDGTGGMEAAARNARYAFLCQVANNVTDVGQVPLIATAHHADDQAETLLLHLIRGSGLRGLGGMRWKTEILPAAFDPFAEADDSPVRHDGAERPVTLIRPLLNVQRITIRSYLNQHQLTWCTDASNEDVRYSRNYLRHEILPRLSELNPQTIAALCRTASVVADEVDRLEAIDRRQLAHLQVEPVHVTPDQTHPGWLILDLPGLLALPRTEQRGVLRAAFASLTSNQADELSFEVLDGFLDQMQAKEANSGPHPLTAGISWSRLSVEKTRLLLSLHSESVLPLPPWFGPQLDPNESSTVFGVERPLALPHWRLNTEVMDIAELPNRWHRSSPWEAWLDADKVDGLMLTRPSNGLRIAPLGMHGRSKSVGDLFTDAKIHPSLRPGWPIVVDAESGAVLWVCGLSTAHTARITETTHRCLHLTWQQP